MTQGALLHAENRLKTEMEVVMKENQPFADYPDVVNIKQLCEMLGGVGPKAAYYLLHEGKIKYFKIGKAFRIPKKSIIRFLNEN